MIFCWFFCTKRKIWNPNSFIFVIPYKLKNSLFLDNFFSLLLWLCDLSLFIELYQAKLSSIFDIDSAACNLPNISYICFINKRIRSKGHIKLKFLYLSSLSQVQNINCRVVKVLNNILTIELNFTPSNPWVVVNFISLIVISQRLALFKNGGIEWFVIWWS